MYITLGTASKYGPKKCSYDENIPLPHILTMFIQFMLSATDMLSWRFIYK